MPKVIQNEVRYDHYFDQNTKRHYVNNIQSVLHCHHYLVLYTQLAMDAGVTELLKECSRYSFRDMLKSYFADNPDIDSIQERIEIGCQYYSLVGLGKMVVKFLGTESGKVELLSSHNDEGWKKKFGNFDKPINYVSAGFVEALFEAVLDLPAKTFEAIETESIVMGAEKSTFCVIRR